MVEALAQTVNQAAAHGLGGNARAQGAVGELAGYQVQAASDTQSFLADAAEELTFARDNTKELDLKERRTKAAHLDTMVDKVNKYQEMMERSAHKDGLERLRSFLKNERDPQTAKDGALKEFGGDQTLGWAALKRLRADLESQAPPEVLAALETAAAELESQEGGGVRAGLTGALAAVDYENLGSPWELGADYRQTACEFYDTPEDMFAFIQEKYGPERFDEAMDFLFKSLGDDLASDKPSFGTVHLEAVGAGLGQARVLNGARSISARLLERWATEHKVTDCTLKPMDMVREFLKIKNQRFMSANDFTPLARAAKAPDIEREVLFMQDMLGSVRKLSPQFFDSPENRLKVLDAAQEALDQAITREDEYLAALEGE